MPDNRHEQLDAELVCLNKAVSESLSARKQWMDKHMADYARYQIGEELFDLKTGERLGVVRKHYRYWADREQSLDTAMNIECEFETARNCFDNTSRQPFRSIGNAQELEWRRLPRTKFYDVDWDGVFGKSQT